MKRGHRFGAAAVMAGVIASGMVIGTAPVEAARKGGGESQTTTCAYLLNVISYPYVSAYVKLSALSLYRSLGCQPPLP